jgi:hypothetical protein
MAQAILSSTEKMNWVCLMDYHHFSMIQQSKIETHPLYEETDMIHLVIQCIVMLYVILYIYIP